MSITYTQLKTALQDYLETDEATFVTQIPRFVKQAEDRIYQSIQMPETRKSSAGTMTTSNRFLSTPSDFISVLSLAVLNGSSSTSYLLNKDVNFIREAFPLTTTTGLPRFYAQWDHDTFLLGPTPDSGYTTELHYFFIPQSIVDAGSNWLGDENESLLLYGSLVEAYTFLKGEDEILAGYKDRYRTALGRAKELGDGKLRKDAYRSGQLRVPVT